MNFIYFFITAFDFSLENIDNERREYKNFDDFLNYVK